MPFRAKPKYSGVVGKSFPIKNRPWEAAELAVAQSRKFSVELEALRGRTNKGRSDVKLRLELRLSGDQHGRGRNRQRNLINRGDNRRAVRYYAQRAVRGWRRLSGEGLVHVNGLHEPEARYHEDEEHRRELFQEVATHVRCRLHRGQTDTTISNLDGCREAGKAQKCQILAKSRYPGG